ncbi:MAG: hypothetical protein LBJ62_03335 [Bifidobacteriaceae bacterium]|jgi:hypothetical protein|nr:hypothetical protein [Bifidobacteriaceae bacterium]
MRRRLTVLTCLALIAGLAACQQSVPQLAPPPKPAYPPVIVEPGQVDRILKDVSAKLENAMADESVEPLADRVGGAALTMAEAQFKMKAAAPDEEMPFALDWDIQEGSIVTTSETWPRSFVVVTQSEPLAPYVYQLEQADPRSPYRLVFWARMLGGAVMPATAPPEVGSAPLPPNAEDLVMTPLKALEAYAVAKGDPTSDEAALFDTAPRDGNDSDPTRVRWLALANGLAQNAATLSGTSDQRSEAVEGSVFAVATADFGALVFGQIRSTVTASFPPQDGASINLTSPKGYTGLGASSLAASKAVSLEHLQTVVLAIPPAGSTSPIRVIAVAEIPTSVTVE